MKILLAGPIDLQSLGDLDAPLAGAPGTYSFPLLSSLARGYIRAGHEVAIVAQSGAISRPLLLGDQIQSVLVPRRSRALLRAVDRFAAERRHLTSAYLRLRPDVIHAHWTYEFAAAALRSGIPTLISAHDSPEVLKKYFRTYYWRQRAALGEHVVRHASSISAVSPEIAAELRPITRARIEVVPNGIDYPTNFSVRPFRQNFVSIANGFDGRKNTQAAIRAFSSYRRTQPMATLTLVGAGHEPGGPAARWARDHGFDAGVHFSGSLPHKETLRLLSGGGLSLLHTSRWEGHSIGMLEAMGAGVPIIAGRQSGGTASTLGNTGVLVDVESESDILRGMSVMNDEALYEGLARDAYDRATVVFTRERMVENYLQLLEGLC